MEAGADLTAVDRFGHHIEEAQSPSTRGRATQPSSRSKLNDVSLLSPPLSSWDYRRDCSPVLPDYVSCGILCRSSSVCRVVVVYGSAINIFARLKKYLVVSWFL